MSDRDSEARHSLAALAPSVLGHGSADALPRASGEFRLSAFHSGERSKRARRQFTGTSVLRLHDARDGEAAVAISDVGSMSLAYVRSSGHDVLVSELQRPNLLVAVTGTLSSQNRNMRIERETEPWILFGRGPRETTVRPAQDAPYQAFVLSMPPQLLGDRLTRLEARGGIICGEASGGDDLHLARLTLALATQLSLSAETALEPRLAEAWTTVLVAQIGRCLDLHLLPGGQAPSDQSHDPSFAYVRRAEELIYEQPIASLREVARSVGVSERTLQTAFRKIRGATPSQVLSQARLHCARRALLDLAGPPTVSEVCSLCGIDHHGRFSRLYKDAFGEYPVTTLKARLRK